MAEVRIAVREQVEAAAKALQEVGKKAWIFASMPVIEGVTPRAMTDPAKTRIKETQEVLPRREGIFRLDEIGLSCIDHAGLYGDACFEGILIPPSQIFLYKEHMWRLWRSAERMRIHIPYTLEDLTWEVLQTSAKVKYADSETGYIRLVLSRGLGDLGINPAKCVGATIFSISSTIRLYPAEVYEHGIELGITRVIRRPDLHVLDPTVKSCNYLNNIMALIEGTQDGGLMESLVLTRDGYIAEATVDNIFNIWRLPGWEDDPSKVVLSTARSAYCLNGITRALVLHMARKRNYTVEEEADLLPLDLVGPDRECFMTGTGAGIMPIIRVGGQQVDDGTPGPISKLLIGDVRSAMADPAFGLSLGASRQEMEEYLKSPSLLGANHVMMASV